MANKMDQTPRRIVTLKSCFLLLLVLSHSPAPNYNALSPLPSPPSRYSLRPSGSGLRTPPSPPSPQSRPQCGFGNFPPCEADCSLPILLSAAGVKTRQVTLLEKERLQYMNNALCAWDWERPRCWGGQQASQSAPMQSLHSKSGR